MAKDYLGDEMPEGYHPWSCDYCTAVCNFEAMEYCQRRINPLAECGFEKDQPESNHGMFGFMSRKKQPDGLDGRTAKCAGYKNEGNIKQNT